MWDWVQYSDSWPLHARHMSFEVLQTCFNNQAVLLLTGLVASPGPVAFILMKLWGVDPRCRVQGGPVPWMSHALPVSSLLTQAEASEISRPQTNDIALRGAVEVRSGACRCCRAQLTPFSGVKPPSHHHITGSTAGPPSTSTSTQPVSGHPSSHMHHLCKGIQQPCSPKTCLSPKRWLSLSKVCIHHVANMP